MTFGSHSHVTNVKLYICTSAVLMTTKFGRVGIFGGWTKLQSHVNFSFRGHVTKESNVCLHLPNSYGHQTWQCGNFGGTPPFNSRNLLITWSRKNEKSCNCLSTIPRASKFDRLLTARLEDPTHQVMWSFDHVVMWNIKICLSAFQQHM